MKNPRKPLLGLCLIGKFVFSHEEAIRQKELLKKKLAEWKVDFVDLEDVLKDGLVRDQAHVGPVVEYFRSKSIDSLFVPHCNFGTEGAVGMIASELGVPTLLWGPRDDAPRPDGTRLRDTLCGLLASSKVLHKLGVPFSYIENCSVDDPALKKGVEDFLRAANAASVLTKGTRIGLIGQRIDFFWSTIINESELLENFGVQVQPIDMVRFINDVKDRAEKGESEYRKEAQELRKRHTVEGYDDDTPLINILAVRDQVLALAEEYELEGLAIQSFMSLVDAMGTYCTFADSLLSERYPIGTESDIHGVISGLLLQRAMFDADATYLTEFTVRHPEDDNGVLLWHAGAPVSMCHPDDGVRLGHHWILPSALAGMPHFRLKDGPLTVARFDGDHGAYKLAVGEGESMEGPKTLNTYVWMKVNDWPKWEKKLIAGPFIHHCAMSYGHYADALIEACKYVPGLEPVRLEE